MIEHAVMQRRAGHFAAPAVPFLASLILLSLAGGCHDRRDPLQDPEPAIQGYVGVESCQACHGPLRPARILATYYDDWLSTAHGHSADTMPSEHAIAGDRDQNGVSDFRDGLDLGTTAVWSSFTVAGGAAADLAPRLGFDVSTARYTVSIAGRAFAVERLLGSGRHQQTYLTRIGSSSYVLPLRYRSDSSSWEPLLAENWYEWDDGDGDGQIDPGEAITGALYGDAASTPVSLGHTGDAFEKNCAGCHVTGIASLQRNPASEFLLEYREDGVACEACHGPGQLHAIDYGGRSYADRAIVEPTALSRQQHRDLCESCHSQGTSVGTVDGVLLPFPWRADGTPFVPGQSLAEAFTKTPLGDDRVHTLQGVQPHQGGANSTYGAWSHDCRDCHSAHDTDNLALIRRTVQTPNSGARSVVFTQRTGAPGSGGLMGDGSDASYDAICEVCHTQTGHHRNDPSTPIFGHHDGVACTDCHSHDSGFQQAESPGGIICAQCHDDLATPLGAASYGHSLVDTLASYPTGASPLRCLSCHADHDVFSPAAGGVGRGANLRADASTMPTAVAGFAGTDFDSVSGGICMSCHTGQLTKSFVRADGSSVTPAIPFAGSRSEQIGAYAGGVHGAGYQVGSTFRGGAIDTVQVSCVKCHNDDLDPKSSVGGQIDDPAFGLHTSSHSRMLAPLGFDGATEPMEEQFCYRCHSAVSDPVGGTTKATADRDWYGSRVMSSRSQGIFAMAAKPFGHAVQDQAGRHAGVEGGASGWNSAASRHVECSDCHNPHAAGPSRGYDSSGTFAQPLIPGNLTAGTPLSAVWGVDVSWPGAWQTPDPGTTYSRLERSTFEWQICLKCHSGYGYGNSPPTSETDQAREFNPNNPSYHAVIGPSRTTYPPNTSFVAPWTRDSAMACSDCHTSDDKSGPQGPHGSAHRGIVAGPFQSDTGQVGTEDHLCFKCHAFRSYGRFGTADPSVTGFSRSRNLHTFHMHETRPGAGRLVTCLDCHAAVPHGWQRRSLLVVTTDPAPYNNGAAALHPADIAGWPASGDWRESSCDNALCH